MAQLWILRPFDMHAPTEDEPLRYESFRPGDEASLKASSHNLHKLRALGFVSFVKPGTRGAHTRRWSWSQMKRKAREHNITGYGRMTRPVLMAALHAAGAQDDVRGH